MKTSTFFLILTYVPVSLLHAEPLHGHHLSSLSDSNVFEVNPIENFENIFTCDAPHMIAAINNILCTSGEGESYHSAVSTRAKLAANQILTEIKHAGITDSNIQEPLLMAVDQLKNIFGQNEQLFLDDFSNILDEQSSKDKIKDILSICNNFDERSTADRKLVEVMLLQQEGIQNMETQIEKPTNADTSAIDTPASKMNEKDNVLMQIRNDKTGSETNADVQEVNVINNDLPSGSMDMILKPSPNNEENITQVEQGDLTQTANANVVKRDLFSSSKKNQMHDSRIKSDMGCNKVMPSLCSHDQVKNSIDMNILMIAKAAEKLQEARNVMIKKLAQTSSCSASGVTGLLMSWAVLQVPMQETMEAAKSLKEAKLAVETDSSFHSLKSLSHILTVS